MAKHALEDSTYRRHGPRAAAGWLSPGSTVILLGAIAAVTICASMMADTSGDQPSDNVTMQASQQGPTFSQRGTIVAITADILTTRTSDGAIQTYRITPTTTVVTADGDKSARFDSLFALHDSVSIVATVRDGMLVATAIADLGVANLNGPPMDFVGAPQETLTLR